MRLSEELESLLNSGPQNSKFDVALSSVIRELRQDWGRSPEEIRADIIEFDIEHSILDSIVGLSKWIECGDYRDGAEPALDALRKSIDEAIKEDWDSVFYTLITARIELLSSLNHENELAAELKLGIHFLIEKGDSIPIGYVFDIVDAVIENIHSVSGEEALKALIQHLHEVAEKKQNQNDFKSSREIWRKIHEIRDNEELDARVAINSIIDTYNREIEFYQKKGNHSHRATAAREAIAECDQWVSQQQRSQWESEFIDGNKKSIEQMAEFSHTPSDEELNELDSAVEDIVDQFQEWSQERNTIFAIKWLVNHRDLLVPSIEDARRRSSGGIMSIVQGRTISEAGESYSQEQGVEFPQTYRFSVQFTQNIRQDIWYRLQNRGLITEPDLFILFNRRKTLPANTHAYLTDFIIQLFENNHSAAVHLGMTQFEAVTRELAAANGKSILSRDEETGELGRRPLSSLVYQIEDEVREAWVRYIQFRYCELSGQNIRNKIAHGYLPYKHAAWGMSVILLLDILQSFLEFEEAY